MTRNLRFVEQTEFYEIKQVIEKASLEEVGQRCPDYESLRTVSV
jgi:hypothetical protein